MENVHQHSMLDTHRWKRNVKEKRDDVYLINYLSAFKSANAYIGWCAWVHKVVSYHLIMWLVFLTLRQVGWSWLLPHHKFIKIEKKKNKKVKPNQLHQRMYASYQMSTKYNLIRRRADKKKFVSSKRNSTKSKVLQSSKRWGSRINNEQQKM